MIDRKNSCKLLLLSFCLSMLLLSDVSFGTDSGVQNIRIYDGSGGVTCEYFDKALGIPWMNRGGDWIDANGAQQGGRSIATVRVPAVHSPSPVEFEVTDALVGSVSAARFSGFVVSGLGGGEVVIASREHVESRFHPELTLSDASGRTVHLSPSADTFTNCSSNSSLGTQQILRAGAEQAILLDFNVSPELARTTVKAVLRLQPMGLYGRPALLSVFLLRGKVEGHSNGAQLGIAGTVPEKYIGDHPDVLFSEQFEDDDWKSNWSILGRQSSLSQVSFENDVAGLQGKFLKITIKKGTGLGLDLRYLFNDKLGFEPEEIYLRYYIFFPNSWATPVDGGKLPGLSGTYGRAGWGGRKPDGYNGWNMRMLFRQQPPDSHPMRDKVAIGTEASIPEITNFQSEGHYTWADGYNGVLDKNRWYCIEQYVKLNDADKANGIIRGWVDGKLAFERTDLVYRFTPALKIEQVWMNVYHGGQRPTPRDISMYIDNVVVSRQYIGPFERGQQ